MVDKVKEKCETAENVSLPRALVSSSGSGWSMANMAAARFPLIDPSRLEEIFSQTLENATEENERKALQPYLQDVPPHMLQDHQYNSLAFTYQYFPVENRGVSEEENDNV